MTLRWMTVTIFSKKKKCIGKDGKIVNFSLLEGTFSLQMCVDCLFRHQDEVICLIAGIYLSSNGSQKYVGHQWYSTLFLLLLI